MLDEYHFWRRFNNPNPLATDGFDRLFSSDNALLVAALSPTGSCPKADSSSRYRTRIPFWNLDLTKCESKATPNPTLLCHWARESFRCCSTSVEGLKTVQSGNLTCKLAIVSKASLQALLWTLLDLQLRSRRLHRRLINPLFSNVQPTRQQRIRLHD